MTTCTDARVSPALAWCLSALDDVGGTLSADLIAGGRSNLTFRLTDSTGRTWILRRPPEGALLPGAHDMEREFRILTALHGHSEIPVPQPLGFCKDPEVLGVPFYVMADVEGIVLRAPEDAELVRPDMRSAVTRSAASVLASLHQIDVGSVGLDRLAPHRGYLERQLKRWMRQVELSGDTETGAILRACRRRLIEAMPPEESGAALVHGDYRFDNLIIDPGTASVRGVVDWEIATIGDPMADLATWMACWDERGDGRPALGTASATSAPGFGGRQDLADYYEEAVGRAPAHLDYYLAFAYWKLACVLQGVAHRYSLGATSGSSADGLVPAHLEWLASRSKAHLARYTRR